MKKLILLLFTCNIFFIACKPNKTDSTETTIEQNMDEIKSSTAEQGKAGKGKVTLKCNGKTFEINGVCGAVTSMGTLTIAIPDDSFPAKLFSISFKNDKLPDATSTYKITKYSIDDKDATHVTIGYTDMRSTSTMIWESDDNTGKLDFVVNGNEIKCAFSNLTLQPSMMYNKGELDATATISGELTIYKN
ncbi:MAG: hypothetical protein IPL21_14015 [Saprospirales bacterium]|nr:hypothetical protein [Saprospirales bacterium]